VLLDDNSIVVAYDFKRGEPRGRINKKAPDPALGDCIDCNACVTVCPTGIDIRNGTQLDCVHCTACMDACDRIMTKVSRPKGLIRYSSMNGIATDRGFRITPRIILYTVVFTALITLISFLVVSRTDVETTILRAAGSLYEEIDDGRIRNLYTVKVLNKTATDQSIQLTLKNVDGQLEILGPPLNIAGQESGQSVFTVLIPQEKLYTASTMIVIEVRNATGVLEEIHTNFVGPEPKRGGQGQ
jgi:cytochrome c oxidase accessory protein FixG